MSQCTCVIEKNEPASRFKLFKFGSLVAKDPMDILCVDVYEYKDKYYLTFLDLGSDFKECYKMKDKSSEQCKKASADVLLNHLFFRSILEN